VADVEIGRVLAWNAEHPDQRPQDAEYWRCAKHYAKKLLRAHRAGEPINPLWVEAMFGAADALPEY
ncbi:MAG: hypothetical protein ACYC6C_14715, partial [Coriobacteriia bacterium]